MIFSPARRIEHSRSRLVKCNCCSDVATSFNRKTRPVFMITSERAVRASQAERSVSSSAVVHDEQVEDQTRSAEVELW